jgi:hypothetical protein
VASDAEPVFPGLSADDILTLYFTKATNRPDVSSTAAVLALLSFTPRTLASILRGTWLAGGDASDPDAAERLVITLAGTVDSNIEATLLSMVRVSVLATGGLTDARSISQSTTVNDSTVRGTWGDASQPQFLTTSPVVALDYGAQHGLGLGDALALRFNQPVAQVSVATKADLDNVLAFDPWDWVEDYAGVWLDFTTLLVNVTRVTPTAAPNATHRAVTAVGRLRVTVLPTGSLTSFDGTSSPSNASSLVTDGSWGDPVCDAGLHVYSHRALVVAFQPSSIGSYVPDSFTVQLAPRDPGFATNATLTLVVTAAASNGSVGLPIGVPATSLRYVIPGLTLGVPYIARVAPALPVLPLSLAAALPRPVPPVFQGVRRGSDAPGCSCATLLTGDGCNGEVGASSVAPALPTIGRVSVCLFAACSPSPLNPRPHLSPPMPHNSLTSRVHLPWTTPSLAVQHPCNLRRAHCPPRVGL